MKKISFLICFLISSSTFAKNTFTDLAINNIPDTLKTGAHAVYRFDSTKIDVVDINKTRFTHNYAISILDEKGLDFSRLLESYNKNVQINDIDAILLDATGKEIRSLKNKDVLDYSSYGTSFEFNSDQRYKIFDFQQKTYPYTIIFRVEETIKSLFFLPDWVVRNSTNASVQSAYLELNFQSDNPVRFKEYQLSKNIIKAQNKEENGSEKITWSLTNLSVLAKQPCSQTENFKAPNIQLSPTKFQLFGHDGQITSWKDFGLFIYQLNVDRDNLSEDKNALVKSMIANETTTYGKIQKLYSYMQQSTRYVADEYGISGWQTFEAKDVCRTGYGDCKGLVNYMKALLKAADIKAYTTLVSAGEDDYFKLDRTFPANNFNHVILCVPQQPDTIWIECTSQQHPAGYLGDFTSDRDVLILTENGGELSHTPVYDEDVNTVIRKATMNYEPNNTAEQTISLKNIYYGPMQDETYTYVKTKSTKDITEMVNKRFHFPSYTVKSFTYDFSLSDKHIPSLTESVNAEVQGIINNTQKRTFINMAWMRNPMTDIFQTTPRTLPIVLNESFVVADTIEVQIPANASIESMPTDIETQLPFAFYKIHFNFKDDKITMTRTFKQKKGVFDATLYEAYQKLYRDIESEKSRMNVVILNKAS